MAAAGRGVIREEKAKPTCERQKSFPNKEQCTRVLSAGHLPHTDRVMTRRENRSCLVGAPVPASHAPQRFWQKLQCGLIRPQTHAHSHPAAQPWPRQGKQGRPSTPPKHPTERSSPPWAASLPVPHEAGPEPCTCRKWHAGSAGALRECYVSREHGPAYSRSA